MVADGEKMQCIKHYLKIVLFVGILKFMSLITSGERNLKIFGVTVRFSKGDLYAIPFGCNI